MVVAAQLVDDATRKFHVVVGQEVAQHFFAPFLLVAAFAAQVGLYFGTCLGRCGKIEPFGLYVLVA